MKRLIAWLRRLFTVEARCRHRGNIARDPNTGDIYCADCGDDLT